MDTIAYFLSLMLIVSVMDFKSNSELVREKRGIPVLTFPRTSPTRMQVSFHSRNKCKKIRNK